MAKGCCKEWIDPVEEEKKDWENFRETLDEVMHEDFLERDFIYDLIGFSHTMESARTLLMVLVDKYDEYSETKGELFYKETYPRIYEMRELFSFARERMEDCGYFMEKLGKMEWSERIISSDIEEKNELYELLLETVQAEFFYFL